MQRDARKRSNPKLVAFKGDPSKLRLSELFLSPLIGLETLDSPKVEALRERAREIELAPKRGAAEQAELTQIQAELTGTQPLPVAEAPELASIITLAARVRASALRGAANGDAPTRVAKKLQARKGVRRRKSR